MLRCRAPVRIHAATPLHDGGVGDRGGSNGSAALASIDVYEPAANTISALAPMATARQGLSATTLLKGQVMLAGGNDGSNDLASSEILDAAAGNIAAGPSMSIARSGHLALLLPNNNTILMVSGAASQTAEIFVPWQNAFAPFGTLAAAHGNPAGGASAQTGSASIAGGVVSGAVSNAVETIHFPMVKTDKPDYMPGETATITGSGFQAGEVLNLSVEEIPDLDADSPIPLQAMADALGNFSKTLPINAEDANIRFYLTATGAMSGLTAGMAFTDTVGLNSLSVGAQSPGTVAQGSTASFPATLKFNGNGSGTCTVGSFSISGAPLGVTATFSVVSVTSTDGTDKSLTMTIHTTGSTPPGNYSGGSAITLSASGTAGDCIGTTKTAKFNLSVGVPTTLTLSAPIPASVTSGSAAPVTLTATLTQTSSGAGVNGQTITFRVDGTSVGTALTNSSGVASITNYNPSALSVGGHTVQAFYDGGTNASTLYGASTSGTQTLTVNAACTAPSVTTNPTNQTVTYGAASVSFSAAASGTSPTVQWQVSTNGGGSWSNIGGATSTTLTLTTPAVSLSGNQYRAVFTNTCGSATTTAATLTVNAATLTINVTAASTTYTGLPYAGATTCTSDGVNGEHPTATLSYQDAGHVALGGAPTNAASYFVKCAAGGTGTNYVANSGTAAFTIGQATLTINVTAANTTYTGLPYAGAITCTADGVNGEHPTGTMSYEDASHVALGGAPTNAASYFVKCAAGGTGTNYLANSGTASFTIDKANATIVVAPIASLIMPLGFLPPARSRVC